MSPAASLTQSQRPKRLRGVALHRIVLRFWPYEYGTIETSQGHTFDARRNRWTGKTSFWFWTWEEVKNWEGVKWKSQIKDDVKLSAVECEESVILKIRQRRDVGRQKYGTSMERTDLSKLDWLRHAQEEAMDLAIYLEKLIQTEQQQNDRTEPRRKENYE